MKQKLLKTMALGLLAMVGVNAWADNTVTVTTGGSSKEYATLKAAIEANVFNSPSANIDVSISADQSLGDQVISWEPSTSYTLTIKATKDITIKGPNGSRWFTVKNAGANLIVGDGNYKITLDGEYNGTAGSKERTQPVALRNNTTASITFNKVTFANFNLNNAVDMIVGENGDGVITLQDITINNCVNPKNAYVDNQRPVNDKVVLKGYLNIDANSTGTAIRTLLETKLDNGSYKTAGRIKVDDSSAALTATKTITVSFTEKSTDYVPQIGAAIIINSSKNWTDETAAVFALANDVAYGVFKNNKDLKLTQAYTLAVTDAGAATLVLPFASTIPTGASCYTLTHSSGASVVTATPVSTTLAANTPVLVEASEGSYKFVSTATSGDIATGSTDQTSGALTGVFTEKTFGTDISSYGNIYILNKVNGTVGFYKAANGKKVGANRCYLTATNVPGAASARGLSIVFGDDETAGISTVNGSRSMVQGSEAYYNLNGQRVNNPTKGMYIVNGKKFIIK